MLTVAEAIAAVLSHARPLPAETVDLAAAVGRVLAADVAGDVDSPPFDKSMMDGFAVVAADTAGGTVVLSVIETVTAGQVPTRTVGPGTATRIMTGAPIPPGADAVVPVERTDGGTADAVRIDATVRPGANVLRRGASLRAGERVYAAGHVLRPQDLGVLAELGAATVSVRRRPRVAILATGDELVPPHEIPGPGRIRNSNESLLVGLVAAAGAEPVPFGIARDDKADLRAKVDEGLRCDLLILSGGVSAGTLDLVPAVLKEAGVEQVFHKVDVKPGKPVWFGQRTADSGKPEGHTEPLSAFGSPLSPPPLVFGLPGNPVSVLVTFELFARTAIAAMLGVITPGPRPVTATLAAGFENRGDRPTYHPARIAADGGRLTVAAVRWAGSADLRATAEANGVAVFEPGRAYAAGEAVSVLLWPGAVLRS